MHCEEFDPVLVHRAKMEEKNFIDKMGVYDVVLRSAADEKVCRVIRTRWSQSTRFPTTLHSCEPDGLHKSSVVVMVTNTSTSLRRLTWR